MPRLLSVLGVVSTCKMKLPGITSPPLLSPCLKAEATGVQAKATAAAVASQDRTMGVRVLKTSVVL